ncbi:MAG: LysM peptidoglycan-binding domain-containing protein [Candidatus Pacebacteria bacterium]|nr:LysM peptidoglycan-binding domain-containing protein [Candidatus Paceibacterota bacterium]
MLEIDKNPCLTGKVICGSFGFIRSNITVLSVIFLLSLVSVSNATVSNYNFQKGSLLFGYLEGKGGGYDGDGNITVNNNQNYNSAAGSETNLIKVASADTSFWDNYTASNTALNDESGEGAQTQTISSGQGEKVNFEPMTVQGNFLISPSSFYDGTSEEQRYGLIKYTVEDGDTPSSISNSFGIGLYTFLWANNMKVGDYIKPGQVVEILPINGVKHAVTDKDTIEAIATKYKADIQEIIIYNELPANGKLTAGRTLVVPNGEKEKPIAEPKPVVTPTTTSQGTVVSSSKYVAATTVQKGHSFPYGQCTWYVSTRFYVPWGGNAKAWLANAAAYGYSTGRTPVAGSIMVTNEHRIYGHVTYVESVTATTITISEMNYTGWARKSVRVVPRNSSVIMGFIYAK